MSKEIKPRLFIVSAKEETLVLPPRKDLRPIVCDGIYGGNIFNRPVWWIGYARSPDDAILQCVENYKLNFDNNYEKAKEEK